MEYSIYLACNIFSYNSFIILCLTLETGYFCGPFISLIPRFLLEPLLHFNQFMSVILIFTKWIKHPNLWIKHWTAIILIFHQPQSISISTSSIDQPVKRGFCWDRQRLKNVAAVGHLDWIPLWTNFTQFCMILKIHRYFWQISWIKQNYIWGHIHSWTMS